MLTILSIIKVVVFTFALILIIKQLKVIFFINEFKKEVDPELMQRLYELYDKKYDEHIKRNLGKITIQKLSNDQYYFHFRIRDNDLPCRHTFVIYYEVFKNMEVYIQNKGHKLVQYDIEDTKENVNNQTRIKITIEV